MAKQQPVVDSLLDSLVIICRSEGIATSRDALVAGLPLRNGKMTPKLLKRAAERVNLAANVLRKSLKTVRPEFLPAIVLLKDEKARVVTRVDRDKNEVSVIFPELNDAEVQMPIEELEERSSGYMIVAKAKFKFDQRAPEVGQVKSRHWFWGAIAENKHVYRDVMMAAFLVNVFALSMPLFTMNVYDRVLPNRSIETLWVMAIGIGLIMLGDIVLKSMRAYFIDWASARIDVKLSANIMEKVMGIRMEQRPNSVGSFAANLRSFESIRDFITSATITTLIDIPFGIIFIAVIGWVAPWMMAPAIIGALLILIYSFTVQIKMHELSETMYRAGALRNSTLIESLVSLETVKGMGIEGQMQQKWEHSANYLTEVSSKLKLLSTSINNGAATILQLVNVSIIVLGVYLVTAGELTMGGLIACTMLASRALAPVAQTAGLLTQYHTASTSLESLDDIMAKDVERPEDAAFLSRPAFKGDIEFKEVSFQYPETDQEALSNVSFKIKAGEHVALLGRMGSGKSTINKLILGLYQPTSGAILIDGIDSRQIDPAELRRAVGYVQQDTHLFFGSLRENLTIAAPHVDDKTVLEAAHAGGIDRFVNAHPKGFDMLVGERGDTLSGGQRQGVGIARALIKRPSVLLLDEPTSAMDHSGEEEVKRRLVENSIGKTVVLISHRSALYDLVERIIVIDGGRVVADGPKEQVTEALRNGKVGKAA